MLLQEVKKPFDDSEFLYEIKFDGFRALIYINKKELIILSRNGLILNNIFPELIKIKETIKGPCILDGEIISLVDGKPSFKVLQERFHLKSSAKINYYAQTNPVIFMAFDLLYNGQDLTNTPLIVRKKLLDALPENNVFKISKYYLNKGKKLFKVIKKIDLEGIVAKRLDSYYQYGKRVNWWLKIKNLQSDYFLVGGYNINKNNTISLYLGEKVKLGYKFVGKIAISNKEKIVNKILNKRIIKKSPFIDYEDKKCNYLKPQINLLIYYTEKTVKGYLRHPKI